MILAGDIGGTKTVLALFSDPGGVDRGPVRKTRFTSTDYPTLEDMIDDFLAGTGVRPEGACFGVAGPVSGQESRVTNLPWTVSGGALRERYAIPTVTLINDLEAVAAMVPRLDRRELHTLNEGTAEPRGTIVIVAPGTGLGTAFSVWTGDRYQPMASEGGHCSFAPGDSGEIELLAYQQERYGHVSFERVCSGGHLPDIYDFLRATGDYPEPSWLREELALADDRTPVIVTAALERRVPICERTLTLFINALGGAISNLAITLLPRGGIYLGGGIPAKILGRLKQPDFFAAVCRKGRFSDLIATFPLRVILSPEVGLRGAALTGFAALSR